MMAESKTMNMIEAINSALDIMLDRDPDVVLMGEDIGYFGGVFRATAGLQAKHGKTRVFDTPISECGIIGAGVGMALAPWAGRSVGYNAPGEIWAFPRGFIVPCPTGMTFGWQDA